MLKINPKYLKLIILIKVIKIGVFVYLGLYSQRSEANQVSSPSSTIDIIWNCPGRMSEIEKESLRKLQRSFYQSVLPKVPARIWNEKAKNPLYIIELTNDMLPSSQKVNSENAEPDALFLPSQVSFLPTGRPEVTLKMRCDLINVIDGERLFVHELFHSLHYLIHPDEPAWLREGLAQVFEYVVIGGLHQANSRSGFSQISTKLESDFEHTEETVSINPAEYGHSLLYFYYLFANCGGQNLFWDLAESSPNSFARDTVNFALQKQAMNFSSKPQCKDFASSSTYFEIARAHNRRIQTKEYLKNYSIYAVMPDMPEAFMAKPLQRKLTAAELTQLSQHVPFIVSFDWYLKNQKSLPLGVKSYALESEHPYRVIELPQANPTNTPRVLLYKSITP